MGKHWLILDSNYLCHRIKWSMGGLSHDAKPTGVVFGFLKSVLNLRDEFHPSGMVFCFDSKKSIRKEIYPPYKATRNRDLNDAEAKFEAGVRRQIKLLRMQYLPEIGFRNVLVKAGYEADDMIAVVCSKVKRPDRATIVSADHDLYSLLSADRIDMYDPIQRRVMTSHRFKKDFGIYPIQWAMVKAMAGCSSDNIPGIAGIGEKTAIKYLTGDLKTSSRSYKLIESKEGRASTDLFLQLTALPLPGARISDQLKRDEISSNGWMRVCKRLGMKSIATRIEGMLK